MTGVTPDGPAAAVGLSPDDVVLSLGEFRIHTLDDLVTFLELVQTGDSVDLRVERQGRLLKATMVAR